MALVAAYCALEAEGFKTGGSSATTVPQQSGKEVVHTQTWEVKPKRK